MLQLKLKPHNGRLSTKWVNVAATVPPMMTKIAFARAGAMWDNQFEINFGGSSYTNVYLSLRDNFGTSGTYVNAGNGGVPVLSFGSGITGLQILHLTFVQPGTYLMDISMNISTQFNAFEMEMIVL
jgi:hypothetical protein